MSKKGYFFEVSAFERTRTDPSQVSLDLKLNIPALYIIKLAVSDKNVWLKQGN